MKTTTQLLTLGAVLSFAPLTSTLAQSGWQTVDVLAPWRGRDIVADADGRFISVAIDNGATGSGGVVSTAVTVSNDGGTTWETVGSIAGYANDLAVAPGGTALFAMGNRSDTVSGRAFLWQSLDHGATWTTFDPGVGASQTFLALDLAVGNSGDIYLCGYFYGGSGWVVRKGHPTGMGGFTWSTVDSQSLSQPPSITVRRGVAGQPDEVLVCGGGWLVRRSLDGGATWTTVDSAAGSAYSLTTSPDGSIYVAGRISTTTYVTNQTVIKKKVVTTVTPTTVYGWQVRRSVNGGVSWANVDYVANAQPVSSSALIADDFGRVFAVGFSISTPPTTWLVRGSSDGGATWVPTDSFLPAGETRAQAMGVAVDALGNVCVIGETGTTASNYAAPIRRLAAP